MKPENCILCNNKLQSHVNSGNLFCFNHKRFKNVIYYMYDFWQFTFYLQNNIFIIFNFEADKNVYDIKYREKQEGSLNNTFDLCADKILDELITEELIISLTKDIVLFK